jgi:hypothetical protein
VSPTDGPTSLALYAKSVPDSESDSERLERCPRRLREWLWNDVTGVLVPLRCRAHGCPFCIVLNARVTGLAIAGARPTRAILLTQVGRDFPTIRLRVKKLTYRVRQDGFEMHWCWHVEPNPSGDGQHHVHGWQRGDFVPQARLSEIAASEGMGSFVRISRIRQTAKAVKYGMKLTGIDYGMKHAEAAEYLEANGKRLVHSSRGFWIGQEGEKLALREAQSVWAKSVHDEQVGEWRRVRDQDVQYLPRISLNGLEVVR